MAVPSERLVEEDRFVIRHLLGSGSSGEVYRAFDRRLGRDVALKRLTSTSGRDLYRFKRAFRAVADLLHPNLVTLFELHTRGDEWFFTMELVDGVPFIDWVRQRGAPAPASPNDTQPTWDRPRQEIMRAHLDRDRLDAALPQLVDGVLALHVRSKLHRDLKPSNVLVTAEGRVVLLDFGLVAELHPARADETHEHMAIGTPAYMSPEQAADRPLTEASDWYAVGVMLYEALTGRRPFEGSAADVMRRKRAEVPAPPSQLAPDVPAELEALCLRLLASAPDERPGGRAILAALGRAPSAATLRLAQASAPRPFIDRDGELAALRRDVAESRDHAVAVLVSGDSGIGKSELVHRFVAELGDEAMVLEGRCYQRESLPFRALDGAIDALAATLLRLPDELVRSALPRDTAALARLFPVLRRVAVIAELATTVALSASPVELRRRAWVALREILAWLGRLGPLVIVIDDVQWGDADSAVFLSDVVHGPRPPPVLLLLIGPSGHGSVVSAVRAPRLDVHGDVRTIELGPLSHDDARRLAAALGAGAQADALARESSGHPLALIELARSSGNAVLDGDLGGPRTPRAAAAPGEPAAPTPDLDALLAQRIATLNTLAAALLRAVCIAGRPLPLVEAAHAAGLDDPGAALRLLVAEHLVRVRYLADTDAVHVEPYHDRIRAIVLATTSDAEARCIHEALISAYQHAAAAGDLDAVAAEALAASDPAVAARCTAQAAAVADAALAFHRAAELYALAGNQPGLDAAERRRLLRRRGEALANAGRLDEAAEAFAEAAQGAAPAEAVELDRLRLEQLLRRGRLPEGLALARRLLAGIGVTLPSNRPATIRELIRQRVARWLRGYRFTPRKESEVHPETLRRIDLLSSIARGLSVGDPLIGLVVQGHFLREALATGETHRACVALTTELGYLGLAGVRDRARIERLASQVQEMAAGIADPYLIGLMTAMRGLVAFELGQWKPARERLERGILAMSEHGTGTRWELDVAEMFFLSALVNLGETHELVHRVPVMLRSAFERGDVYAQHALRGWRPNVTWLVLGRPDDARAHVVAVEAERPPLEIFQLRHYYELAAHTQIDLYVGDGRAAWRRLERAWPALRSSHLLRIQSIRIEASFLRARAAVAAATAEPARRRSLLVTARRVASRLDREEAPWARALATSVRAMVAAADGNIPSAGLALDEAAQAFIACDMGLHASVAQLRGGELLGGGEGTARAASARRALGEQAVVDVDAMARMVCPWPAEM